jgi:hypothetical protein
MVTHDKLDITERVIELLYRESEIAYDLYVVDSGSGPVMQSRLTELEVEGKIHKLVLADQNIGQNLGTNIALDLIMKNDEYEWVVCWSPDVIPKGRRVLKKLIRAADSFRKAGVLCLVAPKVQSATKPCQLTETGDDVGFPYHVSEMLRGFVRVHPRQFFRDFRLNEFGALAMGEAGEIKDESRRQRMESVTVENIKVRHLGGETDVIAGHIGFGLGA